MCVFARCVQVNRTFQELGVFRDLGGMWEEMRPKVWDFMENSQQMDLIRVTRLRPPPHLFFSPLPLWTLLWSEQKQVHPLVFFLCFPPQTLLKNNVTARFFQAQLATTDWTVADVTNFLSKLPSEKLDGALTWREVFNETDQAIMSISRFMEVCVFLLRTV